MIELMSDKGVFRTAPATQGLLIRSSQRETSITNLEKKNSVCLSVCLSVGSQSLNEQEQTCLQLK